MDVMMSQEYNIENHLENTEHCETPSNDCFPEDTKPLTSNVGKQSGDILDNTVERQDDDQESKVATEKREFNEVEAGVPIEADSGAKMTSFPTIGDYISITKTDVNDNASRVPVYEVTTNTSDPSSPVDDMSHTKSHAGQNESLFTMQRYGDHLRRKGDSREAAQWEEPEFEFDDIGIHLEAAAARQSSGKMT